MWILAFLVLLMVTLIARAVGKRLFPILQPTGWRRTMGLGWLGGLTGIVVSAAAGYSGLFVAGVNVVAAFVGSLLFLLLAGLFPFIRIALGKA